MKHIKTYFLFHHGHEYYTKISYDILVFYGTQWKVCTTRWNDISSRHIYPATSIWHPNISNILHEIKYESEWSKNGTYIGPQLELSDFISIDILGTQPKSTSGIYIQ